MSEPLAISVVVTTYNRPKALSKVLDALDKQHWSRFEVIVGDDGSTQETGDLVHAKSQIVHYPLKHVWQEDQGFRAARVRNIAAKEASGNYLVFLDGDCIPRPSWLANHAKLAQKGWFVAGNRVLLSPDFTNQIESSETFTTPDVFKCFQLVSSGAINRIYPLLSLPLGPLRTLRSVRWQKARSCNLAVWTDDFKKVDGFDLTFEGWGFEDSDLAIRLINSGVYQKSGNYATAVLHLHHKEYPRDQVSENYHRLLGRVAQKTQLAELGLSAC